MTGVEPFFLAAGEGQRFCLYHPPAGQHVRGAVIHLPPFAEEMNKARRMVAAQARLLAESGFAVLQMDLLGCGDSSGDFGDATWAAWKDDIHHGYGWLRAQTPAPLILWGLRAGCLLAAEVAAELPDAANFIFWQPVTSGKQHWQQFRRLRVVGEQAFGQDKPATASGQGMEIAGYSVSAALASGLEGADLRPPPGRAGRVAWLELSAREPVSLGPAAQKYADRWRDAGYALEVRPVQGPPFWATTEIEDAPALLRSTLGALEAWP